MTGSPQLSADLAKHVAAVGTPGASVMVQTSIAAPLRRWGIDGSDPKTGDTHFYNYGSDCTDVRFYPRSKFVSEFGTQSYPSFSVLQERHRAQRLGL